MTDLIPVESIISKIVFLREEKVLLDRDLAELYGVETKQLKRAVRRNIKRFPDDFMLELTKIESENLRSIFGTSSWSGSRSLPMINPEKNRIHGKGETGYLRQEIQKPLNPIQHRQSKIRNDLTCLTLSRYFNLEVINTLQYLWMGE